MKEVVSNQLTEMDEPILGHFQIGLHLGLQSKAIEIEDQLGFRWKKL